MERGIKFSSDSLQDYQLWLMYTECEELSRINWMYMDICNKAAAQHTLQDRVYFNNGQMLYQRRYVDGYAGTKAAAIDKMMRDFVHLMSKRDNNPAFGDHSEMFEVNGRFSRHMLFINDIFTGGGNE